jgi:hypothetical protein
VLVNSEYRGGEGEKILSEIEDCLGVAVLIDVQSKPNIKTGKHQATQGKATTLYSPNSPLSKLFYCRVVTTKDREAIIED